MPLTLPPQAFVDKWHGVALKERSAAQSHFNDLCALVGHETPVAADPKGESFTFEAGARKQKGGQGWADVWKKGYFAWEYKGQHADLAEAYQQLLQYREALHNPPLLVVCDLQRIVIHTNFTNTIKRTFTLELDDLLRPESLDILRALFFEPEKLRATQSPAQVTQTAAADFARLAEILRQWGANPHQAAHFLIRLLFCLFAEDVQLLPAGLLTQLIQNTRKQPRVFAAQLKPLFSAMATGGFFGVAPIAHFNGGLFDDDTTFELPSDGMDILAQVSGLDWANIEPSIFGTLFERSLDPSKRAQLGAHYTSKEDILLIVEPVLMAPLRRRWAEVQAQAQKARTRAAAQKLLLGFTHELSQLRILDPACGSGNFLYVALRQLLDLEKEVITFAGQLGMTRFFPTVSPTQLHGIELNPYACELAQTTVWIGYIQWLRENGFGAPSEPILKPLRNIVEMDAILGYDAKGNPIEPEWPAADVIIGNPPFLGSRKMRPVLGGEYCDKLLRVYSKHITGLPDLICYWFEKSRALVEEKKVKRVGLLATQAIRGGANRQVLEHINKTGNIFVAWSDREWVLDGAMVHVSIIGFDDGTEQITMLDGKPVPSINSDLTADVDLSKAQLLAENADLSFQGVVLRGEFDITFEQAQSMLKAVGNPNGRSNNEVIRPRRTGQDVVSQNSNSYVIDFGLDMSMEDAAQYAAPFEYLKKNVYPARQKANQAVARNKWWIHWNPRTQMRETLAKLPKYIATPRVAKHRLFVWLDKAILPDAQLVVFARSDDYFFGVLHSKLHELWARRMGTQLRDAESGFRYTSTTTFETFPLPWPPGREPQDDPRVQAIAAAARELVAKREAWLRPEDASEKDLQKRTLTNLYNERPTWLALAHRKLDEAVLDAYGWAHDPSTSSGQALSDDDILARLLALNLQRAAT